MDPKNSAAKYSVVEDDGLQVDNRPSAQLHNPLERRSSLNRPETAPEMVHANKDTLTPMEEKQNAYYVGTAPSYHTHDVYTPLGTEVQSPHAREYVGEHVQKQEKGKRVCGLRRGLFIAIVVIAFLVVIGAVLGGVLGSVLNKKDNKSTTVPSNSTSSLGTNGTNTPAQVSTAPADLTGMATTTVVDGSGTMLLYYQNTDNEIIELTYPNGTWTSQNVSASRKALVTKDAAQGSPLAAIAYADPGSGAPVRQLFFVENSTRYILSTTQTAGNSTWTDPVPINNRALTTGSPALAACWLTQASGDANNFYIRVYYGDSDVGIRETTWTYGSNPSWIEYWSFPSSDANTGVACAPYHNATTGDSAMNVFLRNTTNNQVAQWYWNYGMNDGWDMVATTNTVINVGSAMTAFTNNDDLYLYFQYGSGDIRRDIACSGGCVWKNVTALQSGILKTRMAASYVAGGPMLFFQDSTSEIRAMDYYGNGNSLIVNQVIS